MTESKPKPIEGTQTRHVVTWHIGVVKMRKRHKSSLSIAICGYSGKVCNIAIHNPNETAPTDETLKPLIIKDVYVGQECEDAPYCINLDCPKNKAQLSHFRQRYGFKTRQQLINAHNMVEKFREELDLKIAEHGQILYYKKPLGCYKPNRKAKT
jgi:hypothetical protein